MESVSCPPPTNHWGGDLVVCACEWIERDVWSLWNEYQERQKHTYSQEISDGVLDRNENVFVTSAERMSKFMRSTNSNPDTEKTLKLLVSCLQGITPTWGMVQERRLGRDVSRGGQ